jgi:ectoine hydroxylase-related dioxygenase (phytanoyl-CoA dioxygenase family)
MERKPMPGTAAKPVAGSAQFALTHEQLAAWNRDGYLIVPRLFSADEVARLRDYFDALGRKGEPIPGHWEPKESTSGGPLGRWPRVMHPHRFDAMSKAMMLHPHVRVVLEALLGEEAVACQSMFYFKPPGAKGQALHQDNFYLKVAPTTCCAAWTALDVTTPDNGGMYLVPGTHTMDIVCPEMADEGESFTTHLTKIPPGLKAVPALMQPGDTLFFNGSVIHGSGPNRHPTRWRRSFICHYMPAGSSHVSEFYFPIHDFAGHVIEYQRNSDGGPCGQEFAGYSSYGKVH